MFYFFLSAFSLILAVLPTRVALLGRVMGLYCALSCLLYGLVLANSFDDAFLFSLASFLPPTSVDDTPQMVNAALTFAIALFAAFYCRPPETSRADGPIIVNIPSSATVILASATLFSALVLISRIGVGTIFSYSGYGTIKNLNALFADDVLGRFVSPMMRPLVALLIVVTVMNAVTRRTGLVVLSALPLSIGILLGLAEASRISAVYAAIAAVCCFAAGRRRAAILFGALIPVSIVYSLEARSHAELGLAYVPEYIFEALSNPDSLQKALGNFVSGLLVMSASVFSASPDAYSLIYKLLSFAPSVGGLDGFQTVLAVNEQRVSWIIPFNAFGEAWSFGLGYYAFLWLTLFAAAATVNLAGRKNRIFQVVLIGIFMLGWSYASQYPVRNALRYFYIIMILFWLFGFIQPYLARRGRNAASTRPASAPRQQTAVRAPESAIMARRRYSNSKFRLGNHS